MKRVKYTSPLIYWATERELIRKRKENNDRLVHYGPLGTAIGYVWSTDPILNQYRFCNVRRKDDRVSQWLIENVYSYQYADRFAFIQVVALCRWINWPPMIQDLMDAGLVGPERVDLNTIGRIVDERVQSGEKSYTGAYMVRAPSQRSHPGVTKGRFIAETVVGAGMLAVRTELLIAIDSGRAERVWEVLCGIPNWGSFMAGQVVADLTYTKLLSGARDLNKWAPQGPGSRRGFNRLLNRPLKAKIDDDSWLWWLQSWREQVASAIGGELNLMDLQNCLCETDKYIRVQNGEGRPRSTYRPETAY